MKFENLDKLFELYVQEAVRKNKEKYSSHEALEDDLGMLFNRFENVRIKTLDGKTPKEYAAELREDGEIFDYVSKCLETISKLPTPFATRSCARKAQPNT
ncbi:MAG: hypothetical protein L6V82_01235 [Clostridiales bacterium]|nr:MAG: hypothetical protein L6V82_01235 [Clostridiales bacterium]